MRKTSFQISRCRVHGSLRFCVTSPRPDGPGRIRRFFATKPEAETYLVLKRKEAARHGVSAFSLSTQDRADWLWASAQLAPYGLSVRKAVETLLPQLKAREHGLSVEQAVSRLLESKRNAGLSERHLYTLENRLNRFAVDHPQRALASFAMSDVEQWLNALHVSAQTANHYRASVHSLFAYGVKVGACLANPAAGIDSRKVVRGVPSILTATQLSALLTACADDAEMQAYVAVSAFGGLRPAELGRLRWQDVKLARGFIEVGAKSAKTSRRRLVPVCDSLRQWLMPIAKTAGPVMPLTAHHFWKRFDSVREQAGLAESWEGNELRHSYASYRLAETQDAAKVALEMGNSPTVLMQHYRELATPDEAATWFGMRPESAQNVVGIAAKAA